MIWHFVYQYFKFGPFTAYFLILLGAIILGKQFLRFRWPFSTRATLIAILLLGIFLRVGWLCYSSHTPQSQWNAKHMLENDWLNIQAIELARDGTWFLGIDRLPSGRRPIGYPMVLAAAYKLLGPHLVVAWGLNLFLHLFTLLFLFKMTQKIFGDATALIAAFLFAIYPMSIYSIKLLTDEHLFLPLWYAGLYMLFQIVGGRRIKADWLWLGIILGYLTMTRTHSIFMPFIVGLTFWLLRRPLREVIGKAILVALVMQLINLPWVIRNYKAWGVPVMYTATGFFVYSQMNSTAGPEGGGHIPVRGEPGFSEDLDKAIKGGNEGLMHKVANREMERWIFTHPGKFLNLGVSRVLDFMCFNRKSGVWALWYQYYPGSFDPARPLPPKVKKFLEECAFVFYYIVFFSWFFSIVLLFRRSKTLSPVTKRCLIILGGCFFFWLLEHMVIFPDRKYRFPLEPLMIIFSAYFFYTLNIPKQWGDALKGFFKKRIEGQKIIRP